MEELRSEIRAAFEREQAAHPPVAGLRDNVVSAVAAHPGRETNFQWLAVAAALLLGVLVVAGLLSSRLAAHRASVPAAPKATPVVGDYGAPPAGVPLVYLQDPKHPTWLVGFDWAGKPRGTVKLAQPIDQFGSMAQAPDGSGFAYAPSGKGGFQQFLDRTGTLIPNQGSAGTYLSQIWADDSRHLCTLDDRSGQRFSIGVRMPGAPPESPQVVAIDPAIAQSGIIAFTLAACSPANDRSVLEYSYFGRSTEFWVVRISDGRILEHRAYPAMQVANVVASPDGALIAINSGASTGQIEPAAPSTTILRASDLSVVATLDPSIGVVGFNSDNSLALVSTTPWASGVATQLALVTVPGGAIVWRYAGGEELTTFVAQPGGRDFAVLLQATSDSSLHPSVDMLIVHAAGTATQVPGRYVDP